jgi:hypothetical protein
VSCGGHHYLFPAAPSYNSSAQQASQFYTAPSHSKAS